MSSSVWAIVAVAGFAAAVGGVVWLPLGVVARLPRAIEPPLMFVPQPAAAPRVWEWFAGLDLPAAPLDDERVARTWTAFSDDPARAASLLAIEEPLRDALVAIAERALGHRWREASLPLGTSVTVGEAPQVNFPVIELVRDRAFLFGGPKGVNQDPFPALADAAHRLAGAL